MELLILFGLAGLFGICVIIYALIDDRRRKQQHSN
jgi:hypothetical protein